MWSESIRRPTSHCNGAAASGPQRQLRCSFGLASGGPPPIEFQRYALDKVVNSMLVVMRAAEFCQTVLVFQEAM
jgi:hypothetical protein